MNLNAAVAADPPLPLLPPGVCGPRTSVICSWVYRHTSGNTAAARAADWLVGRPLAIAAVLLVGWLLHLLIRVLVGRSVRRLLDRPLLPPLPPTSEVGPHETAEPGVVDLDEYEEVPTREEARRTTRAHAVATAVSSTLSTLVWLIVLITILGILGLDLEPIIAGAGLAGIALAFGAQSLIKDLLSGLFILLEDHFGIGDEIQLDEATGMVEKMTLRHTVLRDLDGTVWYIRNGEIDKVRNFSQVWSGAMIDITVVYGTDLTAARTQLLHAADTVMSLPPFTDEVLGPPEVLGVQALDAAGITLRLLVKTLAGRQFDLQRQLLETINQSFQEHGLHIATRRQQLSQDHTDPPPPAESTPS